MFGIISIGLALLVVKKLEKMTEYKQPKGKHANRYK